MGVERYEDVQEQFQRLREGFRVESWQAEVRSWLARGLVAGEADGCRAWLDMALRITGCVQGLPESAVSPKCRVPVRGFQMDLRRLFRAPTVVNPLAAAFAGPAPAEESRAAAGRDRRGRATTSSASPTWSPPSPTCCAATRHGPYACSSAARRRPARAPPYARWRAP